MKTRVLTHMRKSSVLDGAIALAEICGYDRITRQAVATKTGTSEALVSHYWGTMPQLRRAIMRVAVERGILKIIAQGLIAKDANALKAPENIKQQAIQTLL